MNLDFNVSRVMIIPDKVAEKTASGIIIPPTVLERQKALIKVGRGVINEVGTGCTFAQKGRTAIYETAGSISLNLGGTEVHVVFEDKIVLMEPGAGPAAESQ